MSDREGLADASFFRGGLGDLVEVSVDRREHLGQRSGASVLVCEGGGELERGFGVADLVGRRPSGVFDKAGRSADGHQLKGEASEGGDRSALGEGDLGVALGSLFAKRNRTRTLKQELLAANWGWVGGAVRLRGHGEFDTGPESLATWPAADGGLSGDEAAA